MRRRDAFACIESAQSRNMEEAGSTGFSLLIAVLLQRDPNLDEDPAAVRSGIYAPPARASPRPHSVDAARWCRVVAGCNAQSPASSLYDCAAVRLFYSFATKSPAVVLVRHRVVSLSSHLLVRCRFGMLSRQRLTSSLER